MNLHFVTTRIITAGGTIFAKNNLCCRVNKLKKTEIWHFGKSGVL